MSIRAILWALETECPSPSCKLVLIKLADNANDDGSCFPSRPYIAKHTGLSEATVRTSIKKLEGAGLLAVVPRQKDGVNLPNVYQLHVPADYGGGSKSDRGVGQICEGGGSAVTPEPVIEPVIEPRESQPTKKRRRGQAPKEYDEGYEQLWRTYPLRCEDKVAKADIYKHWQDAIDDGADPNVIVLSASQYARAFGHDEYRKGLRAWLRNRAFEQETPKPNGTNGAGNAHRPLMPGEW